MKIKNADLRFYVISHNFNTDQPVRVNVLDGLAEDIAKHIKSKPDTYKHISNKSDLINYLKREFQYHYWGKAEAEYFISGFRSTSKPEKLDIYYQLELNLDTIADHIITQMHLQDVIDINK